MCRRCHEVDPPGGAEEGGGQGQARADRGGSGTRRGQRGAHRRTRTDGQGKEGSNGGVRGQAGGSQRLFMGTLFTAFEFVAALVCKLRVWLHEQNPSLPRAELRPYFDNLL